MLIRFDDTNATIDIPDDADFVAALRAAAFDWPFRETRATDAPIAIVRKVGDRYACSAPGDEPFIATAVSAACSVIVDAVKAAIEANPSSLCFHCGSVSLARRLVVLSGQFRAGKSMLVSRLAANGHTVFGDDVLPLDEGDERGIAIGVAPRLRLPLPKNLAVKFRAFVERHATVQDRRYLYFNPPGRLAMRGKAAPLGAIVLLDRRSDGPAEFYQASQSAALRSLISRNFARAAPAQDLLCRLHRVAERLPRFTLRYNSLEEAADLLERTFANWPPRAKVRGLADPARMGEEADSTDGGGTPVSMAVRFRQNPAVRLRSVDGELFLADAEGWGIHHLNAAGAGLWRILEQPISQEEAAEVLGGAFPEIEPETVARDVARLFSALSAQGFVIEADDSGDCA